MQMAENRFLNVPTTAIIFSISLHLGMLICLYTAPLLESLGLPFFKHKPMENLYQSFIQVDVVGLPDAQISEKQNPLLPMVENPSAAETPVAKDQDDVIEEKKAEAEKVKKAAEDALTKKKQEKLRVEQEKAMKKALEDAKREQALKGLAKSGTAGRNVIKGNILSKGSSSSGAIGNAKDRYTGVLTESIKQHFNIFSWQQKKNLNAEVKLLLMSNGRIKSRRISRPSSDALYDSAVLQAIDDAQPFPIPEDRSLLSEEITINFKP